MSAFERFLLDYLGISLDDYFGLFDDFQQEILDKFLDTFI